MVKHKPNSVKMRTILKTCVGAPFLKMHPYVIHDTNVFDVKILESRAKSFYKRKKHQF